MGSNSQGAGVSRVRPDWYYFDQLPKELREALARSAFDWDSKFFLDRWNSGRWSIPKLIAALEGYNHDKARKRVPYRVPGNFGYKYHSPAYADPNYRVKPL